MKNGMGGSDEEECGSESGRLVEAFGRRGGKEEVLD